MFICAVYRCDVKNKNPQSAILDLFKDDSMEQQLNYYDQNSIEVWSHIVDGYPTIPVDEYRAKYGEVQYP